MIDRITQANILERRGGDVKYIVSFSGGKDSTCMLIELIKRDYQIDEIVFCDTGAEFEQLYEHIELVKQKLGVPITTLQNKKGDFFYWAFEHIRTKGKNKGIRGYGLPRVNSNFRWCTERLKRDPARAYLNRKYGSGNYIEYIGLAFNEQQRMRTDLYPLVYWGFDEKDTLNICYKAGFHWGGLYKIFDRVSCWPCPYKNRQEKENMRKYFPELYFRRIEMENRTDEIERLLERREKDTD